MRTRTSTSTRYRTITTNGRGRWLVDGTPDARLDDLCDVDLQASALTNSLPLWRLHARAGDEHDAPAIYISVPDAEVSNIHQHYTMRTDHQADYDAPDFDFAATLTYDRYGLIIDYPHLATRVGDT